MLYKERNNESTCPALLLMAKHFKREMFGMLKQKQVGKCAFKASQFMGVLALPSVTTLETKITALAH